MLNFNFCNYIIYGVIGQICECTGKMFIIVLYFLIHCYSFSFIQTNKFSLLLTCLVLNLLYHNTFWFVCRKGHFEFETDLLVTFVTRYFEGRLSPGMTAQSLYNVNCENQDLPYYLAKTPQESL